MAVFSTNVAVDISGYGDATGLRYDNYYLLSDSQSHIAFRYTLGGNHVMDIAVGGSINVTNNNVSGRITSFTASGPGGGTLLAIQDINLNFFSVSGLLSSLNFPTFLSGSDQINGSPFSDVLYGYGGNDVISAGAGNDTISGGAGINHIDGGSGQDTVTRSASRAASFMIASGGSVYVGGANGYDRTVDVEYIRFTDQTVSTAAAKMFDPLSYLALNPDLIAAYGMNTTAALSHYLASGYREGRSTDFNAAGYLAANPDLMAAYGPNTTAALQHYVAFGRTEGRVTTFNASAYLARYADLRAAYGTDQAAATMHYVIAGYREGRSAAPLATATRAADALPWTVSSGALASIGMPSSASGGL